MRQRNFSVLNRAGHYSSQFSTVKLPTLAAMALALPLLVAGCGGKIQSDLQLENARFSVNEGGKAQFGGTVKNTGNHTYKSVFIVVDGYEGDEHAVRVSTSADLFSGNVLAPGGSTGFSKEFEDGGAKPNRYEVVRLYGLQ
jgi:hypothetical protein